VTCLERSELAMNYSESEITGRHCSVSCLDCYQEVRLCTEHKNWGMSREEPASRLSTEVLHVHVYAFTVLGRARADTSYLP
jgi:hypothetical protein